MENYRKGKNVEDPLERDKIPIPNLPDNFLWMQVRGGSKIRNLVPHALNEYLEAKCVVWTGFGQSVGKAVTCAEIMKRECNNSLHQITKLCYRKVQEFWEPLLPELDQIVVERKLPMIHIVLSVEPLDTNELGYQAPGAVVPYKSHVHRASNSKHKSNRNKKTPVKEMAAMNVDSSKRRSKQSNDTSKNKRPSSNT